MKVFRELRLLLFVSVLALFLVGCTTPEPRYDGSGNPVVDDEILSEDDLPPTPKPPGDGLFGPKYSGTILAGNEAPYIDFNNEDYQKATSDGKIILLYFYSLQSGPSIADQNFVEDAFNEMVNPNIIGFRVNIDDADTSATEASLAESLKVTKARTKVIMKDGKVLQTSSSEWNSNLYITQLTQYLE